MRKKRKFERGKPTREPYTVAAYATEGTNTEPEYLDALKRHYHVSRRFTRITSHEDPLSLVNKLIKEKKLARARGEDRDYWFALFDREFEPSRFKSIERARALAAKHGIICIETSPTFEYWLVLHYTYLDRPFRSADDVLDELKKHLPTYGKARGLLAKDEASLMSKVEEAYKRATQLNSSYGNFSEMPKLIDVMAMMASQRSDRA